jgi:hypothetical protein
VPVVVLAGVFGVGYRREQRSRAAFRAFAQRHGLAFQENELARGYLPHGHGKIDGKEIYAGYVWVKPFTEGIGPTFGGRSVPVIALTIGSTARIDRGAPLIREFLKSNGTLSEKTVTYSFTKRFVQPLTVEEIETAFGLVCRVAATEIPM